MAKDRNKPSGSRTVERRKERGRERQRRRWLTIGIVIAALVAVVVFVFVIVNAPAAAPIPDGALTRYADVQTTRTKDGYPRLGDPNASVQVAEYSSFDCANCRDFHDKIIDPLVDRVKGGKMALTFVPLYGFGDTPNGQGAAEASICAAEQGKFWPFHDALFDWQGEYGNQAFTNNRISAGVAAFQMDQGAFSGCIASDRPGIVLNAAKAAQQHLLNFTTAPTITINGVVPLDDKQQPLTDPAAILAQIDADIARASVPPTAEVTAEATGEATEAATPEATPEATATAESTPAATAAR